MGSSSCTPVSSRSSSPIASPSSRAPKLSFDTNTSVSIATNPVTKVASPRSRLPDVISISSGSSHSSRSPSPEPNPTTKAGSRRSIPVDAISISSESRPSSPSPSPSPEPTSSAASTSSSASSSRSTDSLSPSSAGSTRSANLPSPTSSSSSQSSDSASPIPSLRSLSPLTRMRRAIAIEQEERRNPSRLHRRPAIVESPEAEPSGCHCRFGHRDFEACSADPRSPYYSPGPGEQAKPKPKLNQRKVRKTMVSPTERQKKGIARPYKKRKAEFIVEEETSFTCNCGGGHETELECEYALSLKKHVEISTSIIIGSQEMVTVIVGTEPQQPFLVHKELLVLFSGYFQDVFSGRAVNPVANNTPTSNNIPFVKDVTIASKIKEEPKKEDQVELERSTKEEFVLSSPSMPYIDLTPGVLDDDDHTAPRPTPNHLPKGANQSLDLEDPDFKLSELWQMASPNELIETSIPRPRRPMITESPNTFLLPNINPSQFAQFVSFIYAGRIIDAFEPLILTIEHNSVEALWYVGQALQSPSFQNNILEGLRTSEAVKSGKWPSPEDADIVFELDTQYGSVNPENKLKDFATDCIGASEPLQKHKSTSTTGQAWRALRAKRPEIWNAIIDAGVLRWYSKKPWDNNLRDEYMLKEDHIEERWETMILARRGKRGVEEAARAGDVGAKLEEEHMADNWDDN